MQIVLIAALYWFDPLIKGLNQIDQNQHSTMQLSMQLVQQLS